MSISTLALIFIGLSSDAFADAPPSKVSCGVINMNGEWVKKPISIPQSKDGTDYSIYDAKGLNIAVNLGDDNFVVTATKGKKILAVLITENGSIPIQVLVPDNKLQVLCNSGAPLIKVTGP